MHKILKYKKNKDDINCFIEKIINCDEGSFLKVKKIEDLTNLINNNLSLKIGDLEINNILIDIMKEKKSVQIYISNKLININDILEIEKDKYYVLLAKELGLISYKNIKNVYLNMPSLMKKNYVFKRINREVFNKEK